MFRAWDILSQDADTVTMDVPFLIRLMEHAREDVDNDEELHFIAERAIKNNGVITMEDYNKVCAATKKKAQDDAYHASQTYRDRINEIIGAGYTPEEAQRVIGGYAGDAVAFDKANSVRTYDKDGRMHVSSTNISKANICEYYGREIPNADKLGLEPDKKYRLLRHPDELKKAAKTFDHVPLLSEHIPITADAHKSSYVIGATGTDAEFEHPYLRNSLVVWPQDAIDDIEDGHKVELSSAYHYTCDMTPGTFEGQQYDGVMRDLVGNHVALVREGRAGSDVCVGDSAVPKEKIATDPPVSEQQRKAMFAAAEGHSTLGIPKKVGEEFVGKAKDCPVEDDEDNEDTEESSKRKKTLKANDSKGYVDMSKAALMREAARARDVLNALLQPKIALDGKLNLTDKVVAEILLALDMKPSAKDEEDDKKKKKEDWDEDDAMDEEDKEDMKKAKEGEDKAEDEEEDDDKKKKDAEDEEEDDDKKPAFMKKDDKEGKDKRAKDEPPPFKGKPKGMDKRAMDSAIQSSVKEAVRMERQRQLDIREAERFIRPYVGDINVACDSAEDVYKVALEARGFKLKDVHPSAYRTILEMQPTQSRSNIQPRMASDSSSVADFAKLFPEVARIKSV